MPTKRNYQGNQQNYDASNGEYEAGPKNAFSSFSNPKKDENKDTPAQVGNDKNDTISNDKLNTSFQKEPDYQKWLNTGYNGIHENIREDVRYLQHNKEKIHPILFRYRQDIENELKDTEDYNTNARIQGLINGQLKALKEFSERYEFDDDIYNTMSDKFKVKEQKSKEKEASKVEQKSNEKNRLEHWNKVFDEYERNKSNKVEPSKSTKYQNYLSESAKQLGIEPSVLNEKIKEAYRELYEKVFSKYSSMNQMFKAFDKELKNKD